LAYQNITYYGTPLSGKNLLFLAPPQILNAERHGYYLQLELASESHIGQNLGKHPHWQQPMKTLYEIQKAAAKSGVPHIHILDMIGGIYFKLMMIRA